MPVFNVNSGEVGRIAVPLVFAAAMSFLMAGSAAASCGDWLVHSSASDEEEPSTPVPLENVPSPCRHGGCRQAPESPLPTAPERSFNIDEDRWVSLVDLTALMRPVGARLFLEDPLLLLEGLQSPPEPPPRV